MTNQLRDDILQEALVGLQRMWLESEWDMAVADPVKFKKTSIFEDGNGRCRYWKTKDGLGREVRFCHSVGRNVAGYFLSWREVWPKKNGQRIRTYDVFAHKRKKTVVDRLYRQFEMAEQARRK